MGDDERLDAAVVDPEKSPLCLLLYLEPSDTSVANSRERLKFSSPLCPCPVASLVKYALVVAGRSRSRDCPEPMRLLLSYASIRFSKSEIIAADFMRSL